MRRYLSCLGYFLITILIFGKWQSSTAETEIIELSSTRCENFAPVHGVSISKETGTITVVWTAFRDSSEILPDGICRFQEYPY